MNLGRRNRVKMEGGMSSMTDLVFLLLIFFIIMSTMAQKGVNVNLPSDKKTTSVDPTVTILNVGVTENNTYVLDDNLDLEYQTFEEVEPIIVAKMAENPEEQKIKVSGDRNADYEYVFRLIAMAKRNGWNPILVFD
ncbi:MAG: ExbD/TolR family protein [Crocinitomicaceae bacterium]